MRHLILAFLIVAALAGNAQPMEIISPEQSRVNVTIIDSNTKTDLIKKYQGKQDNGIRKKWTARTYQLSDGRIVVELFDAQAVLINNLDDLKKIDRVRFVKNSVSHLKKNVSYKIELTVEEGKQLAANTGTKRFTKFNKIIRLNHELEVYELNTGQILFLQTPEDYLKTAIYPDPKSLASENRDIEEQLYGSDDDEELMKKIASGDRLPDYEMSSYLIYPKYIDELIKNHKLHMIRKKMYVSSFFGDLYQSEYGYYFLIDDEKQKNGAGDKMQILNLHIYDSLQQAEAEERKYALNKDKPNTSEHFYQKISTRYGKNFALHVPQLIEQLPGILNIDKEQFTTDSAGMDLLDESLKWHAGNYKHFDSWFPGVLAYYGECYRQIKSDGEWITGFDKKYKVWIPEMKLRDGTMAWDWRDFYANLMEWPTEIRFAGDWDGKRKTRKMK